MNRKGFTLVELIVVITIISILWTISFVSFQNYASDARDSKTISDLSNAYKKVVLFKTETGIFPKPDNPVEVNAGAGNIITFQWEFWESVKRILDYGETILDFEWNNYKYATNGKFWLSSTIGLLENSTSFFSNQTHAEDSSKFLYFKWDDVLTLFDENNKYVSDDVFDLQKEKIIAYLGQKEKKPEKDILYGKNVIKNIPKNIKINSPHFIPYKSCPAGQFSGSFATYRHWEINNENTETLIVESPRTGWKSVSTGIVLCTDGVAKLVSDRRTYVCDMYYTATSRGCNPTTYESCKEIKTLFPDSTSWVYNIIPAWGSNMSVTCDMETSWGGWTVVFHWYPSHIIHENSIQTVDIWNNISWNEMLVKYVHHDYQVSSKLTWTTLLSKKFSEYYKDLLNATDSSNPKITFDNWIQLVTNSFFYGYGNVRRVFAAPTYTNRGWKNMFIGRWAVLKDGTLSESHVWQPYTWIVQPCDWPSTKNSWAGNSECLYNNGSHILDDTIQESISWLTLKKWQEVKVYFR